MLWGDLKKKSGGHKRYRGKKASPYRAAQRTTAGVRAPEVGEEEGKMKFNRGFPLEAPSRVLEYFRDTATYCDIV